MDTAISSPEDTKSEDSFDVLIIGGGINGAGIAREASAAGFKVCVVDAGDFGGATSSASSKLVHGGLRYLEHYEFRLVREALIEREKLWAMAPHIIWPMRFVLPYHSGLRPRWLLRLGLFLYDHLGGRKYLPATTSINFLSHPTGAPLKADYKKGFEYSDCWVEDSRLVVLNLQDAEQMGASVLPRTRAVKAVHGSDGWQVQLQNVVPGAEYEAGQQNGESRQIKARLVVNTAGPWVDDVLRQVFSINDASNTRLVRGSHIVVPKKFEHDRAYIFQNSDDRIVFAIPYEHDYTLIGTTDAEQADMSDPPMISDAEIAYLCDLASDYFKEPVTRDQIVWTYSGVRSLYDDGASKAQEATRDYVIKTQPDIGEQDLINVFGGKITTFRKLALNMVSHLEERLGKQQMRSDVRDHYPGGDFPIDGFDALVKAHQEKWPFVPTKTMTRLTRLYGTKVAIMLKDVHSAADLGEDIGKDAGLGLYQAELDYLIAHEWAKTARDVLFRRTKLGITLTDAQIDKIDSVIAKTLEAVS